MKLTEPAVYTPWAKGKYDVAPSLKGLGADFGNPHQDGLWFQIDSRYDEFMASKGAAVAESYPKYVHRFGLTPEIESLALATIGQRLVSDYPDYFEHSPKGLSLRGGVNHKTCDALQSLDELALLVQEDICVVRVENGCDWIAYLHVCSPSHWLPSEKIGKPFFDVHQVIPGFEQVNRVAGSLVEAMVHKGPFVRFVWGVESDTRPNHHPEAPPGWDAQEWDGRDFTKGRFWVRSERQVIWGLPEVNAAIFTIKVSHVEDKFVLADELLRTSLVSALASMSPSAREYKGLARGWEDLMQLLLATPE